MKFFKTLFFEVPEKDFIMPVYTEDDVNTLKSFLDDDYVLFSVGYKTMEDEKGFYYLGVVKPITEIFQLKEFPLTYRKRVLDILIGLNNDSQSLSIDVTSKVLQRLVYFKMTKSGLKPFITDYTTEIIESFQKKDILDYFIKDEKVLVQSRDYKVDYTKDEIYYLMKNPNY